LLSAALLSAGALEQPAAAEAIINVARINATIFFIEKSPTFFLIVLFAKSFLCYCTNFKTFASFYWIV